MEIDDNLLAISNVIFRNRENWKFVTDQQKIKWFFIINRNLSKIYPDKAQLLNSKNIDKVMAMDTWFYFMLNKPYPKDFWSKSEKTNSELSDKEFKMLVKHLQIKKEDIEYLMERYPDLLKEELDFLKKREKEKSKN
jgi:hypothetical protein